MREVKELGSVRIVCSNNDSIRITDCEFAGKRGKECRIISLRIVADDRSDQGQKFCDAVHNMNSKILGHFPMSRIQSYDDAVQWVELVECMLEGATVHLYLDKEKGVRVQPIGFQELKFGNEKYCGSVEWERFWLRDSEDQMNLPAWIDYGMPKAAYPKIYKFVETNIELFNDPDLTMYGAAKLLSESTQARGHGYCRMD